MWFKIIQPPYIVVLENKENFSYFLAHLVIFKSKICINLIYRFVKIKEFFYPYILSQDDNIAIDFLHLKNHFLKRTNFFADNFDFLQVNCVLLLNYLFFLYNFYANTQKNIPARKKYLFAFFSIVMRFLLFIC